MAIESAAMSRRVARIACLVLVAGLLPGGAAMAQLPIKAPAPVTVGSIIPFNHGATGEWSQIYSMKISPNGNIVFLDSAVSQIYQLATGASTPTLVVGPAPSNGHSDCSVLEPSGSYWNAAVAFDAQNNLYVTDRYGSSVQFCRVPYDPTSKTWKFQTSDNWVGPTYTNSSGVSSPIPPQDLQVGDDGTFYVSTSDTQAIYKFTVNAAGTVTSVTPMVTGMQDMTSNLAVDHAGNLFFLENAYDAPSNRVTGIREVPAGTTLPIAGDGTGKAESQLPRIDPAGAGFNGIKGISFDAQGNLYFSSENNSSYGGEVDGVFMIPNEGTPTAPNLVWADTVRVSPVASGFSVLVDPRGLLWIPTGGNSNWAPPGSAAPTCDSTSTKTIDATCLDSSIVLWKPGELNMGSSPVGTPGATQTLIYSFSKATTPSTIGVALPGTANFITTTNPIADPTANPPVPPCTAGTAYPGFSDVETTATQYSWCAVYLQLKAATAGSVEGELQMLDSSGNVISGSNANLGGVGVGAAAAVVASAAVQPIATGLNDPHQVAADPWSNSYVADSGLKAVEFYKAGGTPPFVGKAFGSSLNSPTGVAVDGAGNLFIGDSGKVIEIPYVNGALASAQQTTLPLPASTTLGNHLNLAADTWGDVFVADQDNKQVVEIPNPQSSLLLDGAPLPVLSAGAGFTGPTAIATDNSGNVWVADGANLWEILMPFGQPTEVITGGLQAPVTGLAVDPSGSVFVAGANGVSWIPYSTTTGNLNPNGTVLVESGLGSSGSSLPYGVALDGTEDIFATYGSGSTAGMSQVGVGGSIDVSSFGEVNPNVPFEVDAQIFNLGNTNLTVSDDPSLDLITGANASDYTVIPATENAPACSASNSTAPGSSCYLGLVLQAPSAGAAAASVSVASNAANAAAGLNIALTGNVIQDLRPATTTVVTAPTSGVVYPGSVTITVTVSSGASYGTPTGSITLAVGSANGNLPKQTQALNSSGVATFTFSNLLGGSYNVSADYGGNGTAGATQNTCSSSATCFAGSAAKTTFVVNQATPAFVVGPPVTNINGTASGGSTPYCLTWTVAGCTPNSNYVTSWAGSTYVNAATKTYILAQVTSTVGTPTGTVSFCSTYSKGTCTPADTTQGINGALPLNGNGVATFSTENLAQGVYNITAVYNGDVNYATQPIAIASFEVIVPSIQVTANPATTTVKAGTPDEVTLTLEPLVGFVTSGDSLKCVAATLPQYTECTFAYPDSATGTISVGSNGPTASTIVVTISTNVPVNGGATSSSLTRPAAWSLAGIFGFGMFGLIAGRRRMHRYLTMLCLAAVLSGVFLGLSSCTNAGYSTPLPAPKVTTPTGTYNVQIITYHPNNQQQSSLTTPAFVLPVTVQ